MYCKHYNQVGPLCIHVFAQSFQTRVSKFREGAESTLPNKVMVFEVVFKNLFAHTNAFCVEPLVACSTKNGVLVISNGLLAFFARELHNTPSRTGQNWDEYLHKASSVEKSIFLTHRKEFGNDEFLNVILIVSLINLLEILMFYVHPTLSRRFKVGNKISLIAMTDKYKYIS